MSCGGVSQKALALGCRVAAAVGGKGGQNEVQKRVRRRLIVPARRPLRHAVLGIDAFTPARIRSNACWKDTAADR